MKVKKNYVSLPPLDYKKAKEIVQTECSNAYDKTIGDIEKWKKAVEFANNEANRYIAKMLYGDLNPD